MSALKVSFYAGATLSVVGAIASALRGKTKIMGGGESARKAVTIMRTEDRPKAEEKS